MKALALMPRGVGVTRDQFREYYETQHVPLALRYFRFRKYVRNHLTSAPDIGFDCVSEFWPIELERTAALLQGGAGDRIREDERQFADQARIVSAPCREIQLAGAPREDDETGVGKRALMLRTALDGAGLIAALQAWAAERALPERRITLDHVIGGRAGAFPYEAILWMHAPANEDDPRLPADVMIVDRAWTRADETPSAILSAAGRDTRAD